MSNEEEQQYWYNLKTGEVEQGYQSPAANRAGPFATREEAAHALDKLRKNSEKWAKEDAAED